MGRRSLRSYLPQAWTILHPSTEFIPNWHTDAICEHLEAITAGEIQQLIINIPPRHTKSMTAGVVWPTWDWLQNPSERYINASRIRALTVRDNLASRRIIESPWYRRNWGHIYSITSDQNAKERYANDKGGERIATSVDSRFIGEGGSRRIIDDPNDPGETSDIQLAVVRNWWDQRFASRVNSARAATVVIMQRCAEADLTGHLLQEGGWEQLVLPGEYEPTTYVTCLGWSDPRTTEGEILCPDRFDVEALHKLAPTAYAYAGQIQQRPAPIEGGMFKRWWWRYWRPKGVDLPPVVVMGLDDEGNQVDITIEPVELPLHFDSQIQSWDMAFKDTKDSAYVCGQCWGADRANRYLLDEVRGKWDYVATKREVSGFALKHPDAGAKLVEDKANGPAILSDLRDEIQGLIAYTPKGSKEARAAAISAQIESGNVYLPHPLVAKWVDEFIEEFAVFPNGRYKDRVDTTSQALDRLRKRANVALGPHSIPQEPIWRA